MEAAVSTINCLTVFCLTSGALVCSVSLKLMSWFIIFVSFVDLFVGELMTAGLSPTLLKRLLPRL